VSQILSSGSNVLPSVSLGRAGTEVTDEFANSGEMYIAGESTLAFGLLAVLLGFLAGTTSIALALGKFARTKFFVYTLVVRALFASGAMAVFAAIVYSAVTPRLNESLTFGLSFTLTLASGFAVLVCALVLVLARQQQFPELVANPPFIMELEQ
jgi:hypothetical protein